MRITSPEWRVAAAVALGLLPLAPAARTQAAPTEPVALIESVASMKLRFGGKSTTASRIESKLQDGVRAALNGWAPTAERLNMEVAVPEHAPVLVLGAAGDDLLEHAAEVADATWALLKPVLTAEGVELAPVVVMALFDRDGHRSDAWPALLDELVARQFLDAGIVSPIRLDKPSLVLRKSSFFLQTTYDAAGNAAAGDDEFRLENEIAHKTATLLLESAFGRQPEGIRWGLGYLAEQRLFGTSYQFDVTGFVAASDHFDWPVHARDWLADRARDEEFSLAEAVLEVERPGGANDGQRCAWIVLDHLLLEQPQGFAALLDALGALDRKADPTGFQHTWAGSSRVARQVLDERLANVSVDVLAKWAGRLKPIKR